MKKQQARASVRKSVHISLSLLVLHTVIPFGAHAASTPAAQATKKRHKTDSFRLPIFDKQSDPHTSTLSPDAVQLASTLELTERFLKLKELKELAASERKSTGKVSIELRQDIADLRLDIIEIIEQTRLDIEYVIAEIDEEQASVEEVLKWYVTERDDRVNRANLWAFRTNGILWAACEAIAIPTYKSPRLSIPSGALGIVAGLVPSVFSVAAVRSVGGKHHERKPYPNMLCKFYDLPTTPRIEYPDSVWNHLNSPPASESVRSRRQILMEHWTYNKNIVTLKKGINDYTLKRISGIDQTDISIELLNDRASMLREVRACVMQISRPLMELSMVLRDKKQVSGRMIGTIEDAPAE